MHSPLQIRTAIDVRAGELSKIGMRRYALENRLLLYPDVSASHSSQMDRIRVRNEFRTELVKDLEEVKAEFLKQANLPLEHWIDG
jgi:hypothetical protein